jgi:hypothetical protein
MQPASLQQQLASGMLGGSSPMNVATQGSPTYDPNLQPPSPSPMPNQSITGQFSPSQMQQPAQSQAPQGQMLTLPTEDRDPQAPGHQVSLSEAEKIIGALESRLKNISKVEQMQQQAQMPQQPQGV